MNPALSTVHRIVRIILGILIISGMATITRFAFIPFMFGANSFYWYVTAWTVLVGAVLAAATAPLLVFRRSDTKRSLRESGVAVIHITSAFLCATSLPPVITPYEGDLSRNIVMTSVFVYLVSAGVLLFLLVKERGAMTGIQRLAIALGALLSSMLLLFSGLPLILTLLGVRGSVDDSYRAWYQMGIYAFIVLLCAVIGLSLVMILRKIRRPTSANSDSHLLK